MIEKCPWEAIFLAFQYVPTISCKAYSSDHLLGTPFQSSTTMRLISGYTRHHQPPSFSLLFVRKSVPYLWLLLCRVCKITVGPTVKLLIWKSGHKWGVVESFRFSGHDQFNLLKPTGYVMHQQFNLLKPTGYVMHQQFNPLKPTGYVMHQQFNLQSLLVTWCTNSLTFKSLLVTWWTNSLTF